MQLKIKSSVQVRHMLGVKPPSSFHVEVEGPSPLLLRRAASPPSLARLRRPPQSIRNSAHGGTATGIAAHSWSTLHELSNGEEHSVLLP